MATISYQSHEYHLILSNYHVLTVLFQNISKLYHFRPTSNLNLKLSTRIEYKIRVYADYALLYITRLPTLMIDRRVLKFLFSVSLTATDFILQKCFDKKMLLFRNSPYVDCKRFIVKVL